MTAPKVGDVVAWADVPDGAMVRSAPPTRWTWWYRRAGDTGDVAGIRKGTDDVGVFWPASEQLPRWRDAATWKGWSPDEHQVTIVALGLTGQETAADLQRMAEVFEVREALDILLTCPYCDNEEPAFETFDDGTVSQPWCTECDTEMGDPHLAAEAEHLHALGWRKGQTAEDAARLLAEADK